MQFSSSSIDLTTLLEDDSGYKYILLMGDVFSKYVEAEPLKNQSAPEVANAFFCSWVLKHRCPSYLLPDKGTNVDSQVIRELCNMFNEVKSKDLQHTTAKEMDLLRETFEMSVKFSARHCQILESHKSNGDMYYRK